MGEESSEDLLLASVHPALIGVQAVPRGHPRRSLGCWLALWDETHGSLVGDDRVAPGIPSLVEGPGVVVGPLGGNVVWCMHGTKGEIRVGGLPGCRLGHGHDLGQGSVDEVLGQVVAIRFGRIELDVVVVLDEIWLVLVRVALEEPVVALEPETERPAGERTGIGAFVARDEVPLADGPCRPPCIAKQARRCGGGGMDATGVARVIEGDIRNEPHADVMGVAPGEERSAGGRAHRGHVEARVAQPLSGKTVDVRCRDR